MTMTTLSKTELMSLPITTPVGFGMDMKDAVDAPGIS